MSVRLNFCFQYNSSMLFSTVHRSLIYPSIQFPSESVMRPSYASDPTPSTSGIGSPQPPVILGGVRNLDYPSLVVGAGGVVSTAAVRPMTSDGDRSAVTTSVVHSPPGGEAGTSGARGHGNIDEGTMELLSAEMNASALYLHDLHLWKKTRQVLQTDEDEQARRMWQVTAAAAASSGIPPTQGPSAKMPNIQEGVEEGNEIASQWKAEKDYLLDSAGNVYS